jgi:hypothetical protein
MTEKFRNKYRIPSNRLRGWDYASSGHYYITIVTAGRDRLFGDIVNGEMVLNDFGQIVYDEFFKSFETKQNIDTFPIRSSVIRWNGKKIR